VRRHDQVRRRQGNRLHPGWGHSAYPADVDTALARERAAPPPPDSEGAATVVEMGRLPAPLTEIWEWQAHGACREMDSSNFSSRTGAWSVPGHPGAESQAGVPTLPGAGGVSSTRPDRGRAIRGLGRPDRGRTPRGHPRTTSCWPICPPARCAGQARISPTQTGRRGRGERVGMSDFRSRAACRDVEPELFFPVGTGVTALR
jgi:hypothetical protein